MKNTDLRKTFLPFLFLLCLSGPALAADSTVFDPRPVSILADSSSVPVGTIVAWPSWTNPKDADKWLECNGQAITAAAYPALYAIVGGNVPNYSGMFLRGYGSQTANSGGYGNVSHASGNLGALQGDAIRNITGGFDWQTNSVGGWGAFDVYGAYTDLRPVAYEQLGTDGASFNAAKVVPTANENRPVNMAVRYLIRAR